MPPLTPAEVFAIERLYAEYNDAIRLADGDAWAACFTDTATFSNRRESVTGREALAAYGAAFSTAVSARYWINNLLLEATESGATGTCYLEILHVSKDGAPPRISLTGVYTDVLVRENGRWKFASRHIARDE